MPQKVSGKKYLGCKEWQGIFLKNLNLGFRKVCWKNPVAIRNLRLVLAEYARLNFASKKPVTQQKGITLNIISVMLQNKRSESRTRQSRWRTRSHL